MKTRLVFLALLFSAYVFSQDHLIPGTKAKAIFVSDWLKNTTEDKNLKGKNIVLLFWNPGNTSQYIQNKKIDYIEKFNVFREKYPQKDLYFLSMASNENVDEVKNYLKNHDFKTIAVFDKTKRTQRGFGKKDGSIHHPLVILIDKNETIKCISDPYSLDEDYLKAFLNNTLEPWSIFRNPKIR